MADNNSDYGGCAPKSGDHACPLKRGMGFNKTLDSMSSKTRSAYKGGDMNNLWQGVVSKETGARAHRGWRPE